MSSLQDGPTALRPTYRLIQLLRALAALMVVVHHTTIMLYQRDHLPASNWIAGSSGVDIFFVISGFVMTISSAPLQRAPHPARVFLARRLERVVPLYWLVTTAKVVLLLLAPAVALNGLGSLWHVLSSYLFIPSMSAEGRLEPVVVVGWTLNFEMAFYVLFAVALARRWRPILLLAPVLLLVPFLPPSWVIRLPEAFWGYISTSLWEFGFGMLLGLFVQPIRRLPQWIGWLLLPGALWLLMTWNAPATDFWRGTEWGIPATIVVFSALVLEAHWGQRSPRWALELGDASYSIYLVHTFTLPAVGLGIARWRFGSDAQIPAAIVLALLVSIAAGELLYRGVEMPVNRWFKGRRKTAIPANA